MADWWAETRERLRLGEVRDVELDGPPCLRCKHWRPRYSASHTEETSGFRLCDSNDSQYQDFSCFEEKT